MCQPGKKKLAGTRDPTPQKGQLFSFWYFAPKILGNFDNFLPPKVPKIAVWANFWPILGSTNFGPALCTKQNLTKTAEEVSSDLGGGLLDTGRSLDTGVVGHKAEGSKFDPGSHNGRRWKPYWWMWIC